MRCGRSEREEESGMGSSIESEVAVNGLTAVEEECLYAGQ